MTQSTAALVSALMFLPFLGGPLTERFAQEAGAELATRDGSPRASSCLTLWSIRPVVYGNKPAPVLTYGLKYDDLDRLLGKVPTIKRDLPIREIPRQIRHLSRAVDGSVIGTTHEYAAFARLEIDRGRFLTPADEAKYENCAVIAAGTAQALYPEQDPIGQSIKLGNDYYTVVGVTKWSATKAGEAAQPAVKASDKDVYIPLSTCRLRMAERLLIDRGGVREWEEFQLSQIIVQLCDGSDPEDAAALIKTAIKPFHPKDDVGIVIGRTTDEHPPIRRETPRENPK